MDTLHQIKEPISQELALQSQLLQAALKSNIALIDSVSRYFLEQKGKMVRPMMVLLSAKLTAKGPLLEETHRAAVALELLHNASLIHDDVVDESAMRRGTDTINQAWDNKVAVLMGDFFLARCLVESTSTGSLAIQRELSQLASSLSEGEMEQLANARGRTISQSAYYSVIKNKTASLFVACMRVGALSVGASAEEVDRLGLFGEKLGMVFQIRDDIFDYYPSDTVGKPTGNDIREGKVTLPMLYALEQVDEEEQNRQITLLQSDTLSAADIAQLMQFAKDRGGIAYAEKEMRRLANDAIALLSHFEESPARQSLALLVDFIIQRKM